MKVSWLLKQLPASVAGQLQAAAKLAGEAARNVRAETNAGVRLLRVSRDVNEETLRSLHGCATDQAESYDANANRIGNGPSSGRLVIGTA